MCYNENGETRVPYWSNPDVSFAGAPTGVSDSDNARVLRETAKEVASWCVKESCD